MTDTNLNRDTQASNWLNQPNGEGWWWFSQAAVMRPIPKEVVLRKVFGKETLLVREGEGDIMPEVTKYEGRWQKILNWIGHPDPNYKPKHN